jgi:hypothetical protein
MTVPALHSDACLNCGTTLSGQFCSSCGQRDIPPYPSTRELVVDAFWELSGWDGRFVSTVRALVQRPGMLTREFLEGRRARYLSPLRLYLLASLAYFVLAAAAPNVRVGERARTSGLSVSAGTKSRPERVADATNVSLTGGQELTAAERAEALKEIERAPALMRPFLRRAVGDPKGFKRGMVETMPKMLFALLPVFAAILGLFYRGRKYPEHLYFAIHLHAFIFLALSLVELAKFTRVESLILVVSVPSLLAIPVYATLAFRRVYGGSLALTVAKEGMIAALYALTSGIAFVGMLYWVSVRG